MKQVEPKNCTILIVDDDPSLLKLLKETLEAIGYTTLAASDGHTALRFIRNSRVDLVIADINMPDMDGLTVLKEVKAHKPDVPVLLITGVNMNNIKERVYQLGADAFLDKPFRISRIEELLQRLLSGEKQGVRILLVDDNDEFRRHLAAQLEELGYRVTEARDGTEAIEKFLGGSIDSVVTDWKMPDIDGLQLVQQFKAKAPSIRIIIISGQAMSEQDRILLINAADGFLAKPFRLENIKDLLEQNSR